MKKDLFDSVVGLFELAMFVGAIWFWSWLADYRVGCMFDSSPRACAKLAQIVEERAKND